MMTAKPPTALPGSIGMHLPAFKRKRIEQWCEDVAQYLKAGSLCRSVIGHVIEDGRLCANNAVKSAPAGSSQRTNATTTATTAAAPATSIGTMAEMLCINNNKKESGSGGGVNANGVNTTTNNNTNNASVKVTKIDTTAPPPGRGTPMPDTSGPLPVVKFTYSTYNEQRRRIDRLVQGLPVLSAPATPNSGPALERLSGAVVYLNGEEPGRSGSRERQSRPPRESSAPPPCRLTPRSASRSSSGDHRQPARTAARSQAPPRPVTSPSAPPPVPPQPPPPPSQLLPSAPQPHPPHHQHHHNNKVSSSEIVVIEHDYHNHNHNSHHGHHHHSNDFHTGFRSLNFEGNPILKRSQSQKLHKARQRILASTRRSRDPNGHVAPGHVPVQSCWAMAELTW